MRLRKEEFGEEVEVQRKERLGKVLKLLREKKEEKKKGKTKR